MSLAEAGRTLKVDARLVGRVINLYVQKAKEENPLKKVERLSVDETSTKKCHNYITDMTDLEEKKVVGVSEGRDLEAFNAALCEMEKQNAPREAIKEIAMDMSAAYISAVNTLLLMQRR
jgi:transposase